MIVFKTKLLLVIFIYGIFNLISCDSGEDLILPPRESHRVSAYINGNPLEESAIIRQNDQIRPYFARTVFNDHDIKGLIVFLQDFSGEVASEKIHYTLEEAITPQQEQEVSLKENKEETIEVEAFISSKESEEKTEIVEETAEVTIEEKKSEEHKMVFIESLDEKFQPFVLEENTEIGYYLMVFQVLGERNVLYKVERPVFYIGNAKFNIDEVKRYLPSQLTNQNLIPPNTYILLSANILFDKRLDPYIIWYNGRNIIAEGKVSSGADSFIWRVPEQTGFYTIKALVFPFQPSQRRDSFGKTKELSLAVSSKSNLIWRFSDRSGEFLQWYQLHNDLLDTKNISSKLRSQNLPRWLPYNEIYGLAIGKKDVYFMPEGSFSFSKDEEREGKLVFHLLPISDGIIFKSAFKIVDSFGHISPKTLNLKFSSNDEKFVLQLSMGDDVYEEVIDLKGINKTNFITTQIKFSMSRFYFSAQLFIEEYFIETGMLFINFLGKTDFLTGEGVFQLGDLSNVSEAVILDEFGVSSNKKLFSMSDLEAKIYSKEHNAVLVSENTQ